LRFHSTVAPTSISLNKPENIIEGEEFSFDCNSTGADPVSVYEYSKYFLSKSPNNYYTKRG